MGLSIVVSGIKFTRFSIEVTFDESLILLAMNDYSSVYTDLNSVELEVEL